MTIKRDFGLKHISNESKTREKLQDYINLKLASHGLPTYQKEGSDDGQMTGALVQNIRIKNQILSEYLPPADKRIQDFLESYLEDTGEDVPLIPTTSVVLDRYGMARELSIPPDKDEFVTDIVNAYRVKQGVLNNPKNDRRTTKGSFHITEGGLPIPEDKKSIPKVAFARLFQAAMNPPEELMELPYTASQDEKARTFISLLLRPIVQPEVTGIVPERSLEVRFFAPGNLASNLDFVESIFGNSGDPFLPENDSALDPIHWTGHTGCIILAPHLVRTKKKDLGLPHISEATERQKRDGMCYEKDDEFYNDGTPFKITARDDRGVMVTLIADNYYGYSKKEIKTQIGYSANLLGLVEEEHAGGALAFPSYNLGLKFIPDSNLKSKGHTYAEVKEILGDRVIWQKNGYGVDKQFPLIIYLPEDAQMNLQDQLATWTADGKKQQLHILPDHTYIHPTGYKIHMEQHPATKSWRLVGTTAEGTLCHKPCTVSGGGKSEISKSIWDAIHFNPIFINDFEKDMTHVEEIINKDFGDRFKEAMEPGHKSRSILSEKRSLGSVIKLLSPSKINTDAYNSWVSAIPHRIKALVFLVKRFYQPEWGANWREHFSVDVVNGSLGNIFKFDGRSIQGSFLRIGLREDGSWWTYKLRQDYMPASKVQWEDDISSSIILPADQFWNLNSEYKNPSVKITVNCEHRFFQRPDEAIHRGYDKQAEMDLSSPGNFISNFEPMKKEKAWDFIRKSLNLSEYTEPVQKMLREVAEKPESEYFILSSEPRIVNGAPTKNPRYLQTDPTLLDPMKKYLADIGVRLYRKIPKDKPVHHPVNAVLPGRRNNPADHVNKIRPLAVYGPIHFQELPELFMDFICSLTGKSPSTTGAGSEGALTKGPFNALTPTSDLNNALLGFILTGYNGYSSAAGYIGHKYRVDHDISLLIPELWARLSEEERDPAYLIKKGYLEKIEDFDHDGKTIFGSRLGYRITKEFNANFLGRIFDNPGIIFNEEMLKPETQNLEDFVDGINNIVEAQEKVAKAYLRDGSDASAIPPLKALLHIMANGSFEGKDAHDPEIRKLFNREEVIKADWYKERLVLFQNREMEYLKKEIAYIKDFLENSMNKGEAQRIGLAENLAAAEAELKKVSSKDYLNSLVGTIGLDPLHR
jgi:hypothetical protein